MDEQKNDMMQGYAALNDVPCDSPLRNIDPDDMMMLLFLLLLFSGDPSERNTEEMRERVQRTIEEIKRKEGEDNNVQPTNDRT